jgi:CheY-like chemotaxis protein
MLVRRGLGNEREQRLIDGALQSAERAKTLVQRLLAFARRQPLQPVAVDIAGLVNGIAGLIGSTLGPAIDISIKCDADLPPAQADPNQLEMALLNLAVNARDAMPNGGKLTVRVSSESAVAGGKPYLAPGQYVVLSVTDSGVGMDEATLARAVEPFFSTKGVGKGTGLGLSMVHGLAAQLGGRLTIESGLNTGTTASLWLPFSSGAVVSPAPDEENKTASGARGTVIVVDDEVLVRMSTAAMLMDLGFDVVEAGSAEEALKLMATGTQPDLIVTDHLMSGMTGVDLAHQAKALRLDLPVLLVSGYADFEGVAPDLPRLTKPFRNADLAASVAALIPKA